MSKFKIFIVFAGLLVAFSTFATTAGDCHGPCFSCGAPGTGSMAGSYEWVGDPVNACGCNCTQCSPTVYNTSPHAANAIPKGSKDPIICKSVAKTPASTSVPQSK